MQREPKKDSEEEIGSQVADLQRVANRPAVKVAIEVCTGDPRPAPGRSPELPWFQFEDSLDFELADNFPDRARGV